MSTSPKNTVLIHGFGFDRRTWYPLELAYEGHRIIYLDLPGFDGKEVTEAYSIHELAKKNWAHLDQIGVRQIGLVGHSMGGYVCLEMLALQPERVSGLVLLHSHVFADTDEKKTARTATMTDIKTNGRSSFMKKFYSALFADVDSSAEIIKQFISRGLTYDDNAWYFGTMAMRDRSDHRHTLTSSRIPVLLLMGGADKAVPVELALEQSTLADRASMHLYESVGHMGMYENTHQVIGDLIRFYEEFGA